MDLGKDHDSNVLDIMPIKNDASGYDETEAKQVEQVKTASKIHCVDDLLHSGATWEI